MNPLEKLLKKIGVKNYLELNEEEKETYKNWEESLRGRKLTDDDVANFLSTEENDTINKLISKTLSDRDDIFLKMKLEMILKIKNFLNMPEFEKKVLEQNINKLI
jgi:hypothetical protein